MNNTEDFKRLYKETGLKLNALAWLLDLSHHTLRAYSAGIRNVPRGVINKLQRINSDLKSIHQEFLDTI